jgi:hypothetical protein
MRPNGRPVLTTCCWLATVILNWQEHKQQHNNTPTIISILLHTSMCCHPQKQSLSVPPPLTGTSAIPSLSCNFFSWLIVKMIDASSNIWQVTDVMAVC